MRRFFVDQKANGELQVVEAVRGDANRRFLNRRHPHSLGFFLLLHVVVEAVTETAHGPN